MSKAKPSSITEIEAYLTGIEPVKRAALEHIRALVKQAAPEAREAMVYGVPGFRQDGPLVCYAAFKAHCGFYPMGESAIDAFEAQLLDFATARGTIRFTPDQPLPDALVIEIVNFRLAENAARKAGGVAGAG